MATTVVYIIGVTSIIIYVDCFDIKSVTHSCCSIYKNMFWKSYQNQKKGDNSVYTCKLNLETVAN